MLVFDHGLAPIIGHAGSLGILGVETAGAAGNVAVTAHNAEFLEQDDRSALVGGLHGGRKPRDACTHDHDVARQGLGDLDLLRRRLVRSRSRSHDEHRTGRCQRTRRTQEMPAAHALIHLFLPF